VADDKKDVGSPDRDRINLNEDYEVQYWTKELGISEQDLRRLLAKHGSASQAVREALKYR
jgi:hypothetical protein